MGDYAGQLGGLGRKVKAAIRGYASGLSQTRACAQVGISQLTFAKALKSPAGRAYLAKHRERVDAHSVLLAATVPFMDLLRAIETGRKPTRTPLEREEGEGEA